jgi:DNA-binding CsgD family transcriptional regulator
LVFCQQAAKGMERRNVLDNRPMQAVGAASIGVRPHRHGAAAAATPLKGQAMFEVDLDNTVRGFYRSAIGDVAWDPTLRALCTWLGAQALRVWTTDPDDGRRLALHQGDDALHHSALDDRLRCEPLDPGPALAASMHRAATCGAIWMYCHASGGTEVPGAAAVARHAPTTRHALHGAHRAPVTGVAQSTQLAIAWPRSKSALDAGESTWLCRMGRHLGDALHAHHRLRRRWPHAQTAQALLERQGHASWLLRGSGNILFSNAAARAEQARGTRVRPDADALSLCSPTAQCLFEAACARTWPAASGQPVPVPLDPGAAAGSGGRAQLVLRRLDGLAVPPAFAAPAEGPVLLAALLDTALSPPLDEPALVGVFGFTPAEARVAACMAQGRAAPDIAAQLMVAPSTVRSHLRQVLAKLGVARKLDAVRVLAQAGWMLRPDRSAGVARDA